MCVLNELTIWAMADREEGECIRDGSWKYRVAAAECVCIGVYMYVRKVYIRMLGGELRSTVVAEKSWRADLPAYCDMELFSRARIQSNCQNRMICPGRVELVAGSACPYFQQSVVFVGSEKSLSLHVGT